VTRLSASYDAARSGGRIEAPRFTPAEHGVGIVHLGLGAFHRAHQAVYTHDALALAGGDWRICGVSLRSTGIVSALQAQDWLYTLTLRPETARGETTRRIIASFGSCLAAAEATEPVLAQLAHDGTRIVSTTVTEQGYGFDRAAGTIDPRDPVIARDLAQPRMPKGTIGMIVEGLRRRRDSGLGAYSVLCCDNLPDNGALLRQAVIDFAGEVDAKLSRWIAEHATFPGTMVDRITPATTPALRAQISAALGLDDAAPIETEPFSQWVMTDDFCAGCPAWDAAGALLVADVAPYETMKLRMLNGAHSMLAYAGFLAGHRYVRDVMQDRALSALVARHMEAAARTLRPLESLDTEAYAQQLLARFRNPNIAHETYQIAMDGSQKLPQRVFAAASDALLAGQPLDAFAFATAAWIRYGDGAHDNGKTYDLRDPRAPELTEAWAGAGTARVMVDRIGRLPGLMPEPLAQSEAWCAAVASRLDMMRADGMPAAIRREAEIC
jgi:fructuronate reductase